MQITGNSLYAASGQVQSISTGLPPQVNALDQHESSLQALGATLMGTFRVEVQAVGGHGCQRDKKDGETVEVCGEPRCPDCITRAYIAALKAAGVFFDTTGSENTIGYAKITHWPGQRGTVFDNLLTGRRSGSF